MLTSHEPTYLHCIHIWLIPRAPETNIMFSFRKRQKTKYKTSKFWCSHMFAVPLTKPNPFKYFFPMLIRQFPNYM